MIDPKQGPLFSARRDAVASKLLRCDPAEGISADTTSAPARVSKRPFTSKRRFSFVS